MNLLECIVETAKKNLAKDGQIAAVFMLLKGKTFAFQPSLMSMLGKICAGSNMDNLNDEDIKTRDHFLIGGLARAYGADRVIIIMDAAFRTIEDPENFKYDETEAVLTYPKSMRTECIVINETLLPSGQDKIIMVPYKGGNGEPIEFITNDKISKALNEGAKFKTRFTELILEGYNKAGSIL